MDLKGWICDRLWVSLVVVCFAVCYLRNLQGRRLRLHYSRPRRSINTTAKRTGSAYFTKLLYSVNAIFYSVFICNRKVSGGLMGSLSCFSRGKWEMFLLCVLNWRSETVGTDKNCFGLIIVWAKRTALFPLVEQQQTSGLYNTGIGSFFIVFEGNIVG